MKTKAVTSMVVYILFVQILSAQTNKMEELKNLVNASFGHFPKIAEVDNSILIAQEKLKLTELNKQPDFTADASYAYIKPKIELPLNGNKFQFAPVNNFNAALNGNYTLLDFGRLKALIQQSKNELTFAKHNKELVQHQLAYQVANIYYYSIYLKKAIAIQDTILHTLAENKQIIESQLKNGTALEIDLLSIQSNIDAEENRKTEIGTLMRKQEILLEYATGVRSITGNSFELVGEAVEFNRLLENNLELLVAQDKVEQAKQDVSIVSMKYRPVMGLRASMGTRNGYIPNINEMRFNYLGGLSFSMPLYNGGKIKQQVKLQEKLADQQTLALESMRKTVEKDIYQSLEELKSAKERLSRSSSQIQVAKAANKLAMSKLKNGTGTHLETTAANTNLQRTLLNQLQLEFQVCNAQLEVARLTGKKFW
jgi:outer membrane protein